MAPVTLIAIAASPEQLVHFERRVGFALPYGFCTENLGFLLLEMLFSLALCDFLWAFDATVFQSHRCSFSTSFALVT